MTRVIMICGKIASGKSVYAEKLCAQENAVMLSVDELVLSVLGNDLGDRHDEITDRIQDYLFRKSAEIVKAGANVLLDWGFWTRERRAAARAFYRAHGIACEFHYIDVPEGVWRRNIAIRNQAVLDGKSDAYFVDDGLMKKLESLFESPSREEIDVWFVNDWR
ncbi:MAG: ATP-binding protein [Clostridiales bacterium]|nr:ATP-binding protein [Clostridiales bacterium]